MTARFQAERALGLPPSSLPPSPQSLADYAAMVAVPTAKIGLTAESGDFGVPGSDAAGVIIEPESP